MSDKIELTKTQADALKKIRIHRFFRVRAGWIYPGAAKRVSLATIDALTLKGLAKINYLGQKETLELTTRGSQVAQVLLGINKGWTLNVEVK